METEVSFSLIYIFFSVTHYLTVTKAADLKSLHKLLFMRAGTIHEIKKNIKKFSGTTEAKDSKEREKRLAVAQK